MPYCPKCGMEFVEGITVCTDCGAPLFESEEAAKAAEKEREERAIQQREEELDLGEDGLEALAVRSAAPVSFSSVYVNKSERYEDMKSSASAFLILGCGVIVLSGLCLTRILPLPASSSLAAGVVLGAVGLAFLWICFKTRNFAAAIREEAVKENQQTEELVSWFLTAHPAEALDRLLDEEAAAKGVFDDDTPEERSLKRYELIQDYLITEQDLPDPSYVDALCEEIYNKMYGQE